MAKWKKDKVKCRNRLNKRRAFSCKSECSGWENNTIGKKIIDKIIKEGLVSVEGECVSVWREDSESVLTDFVNDHISQEGKKVACGSCSKFENEDWTGKGYCSELQRTTYCENLCMFIPSD